MRALEGLRTQIAQIVESQVGLAVHVVDARRPAVFDGRVAVLPVDVAVVPGDDERLDILGIGYLAPPESRVEIPARHQFHRSIRVASEFTIAMRMDL